MNLPESSQVKLYAEEIVRDNPDAALPFIRVIHAIADPDGDRGKYQLAWELMRSLYALTPDFEDSFKRCVEEVEATEVSNLTS